MKKVLGLCLCAVACLASRSALGIDFDTPQDEAYWNYRQAHGLDDVLSTHSLIDDYLNELITPAAFEAELWQDKTDLTAHLYSIYGSINNCFLQDLVLQQANDPIGVDGSGTPFWFDTSQYLDANGNVIPEMTRAYNGATRANNILAKAVTDRTGCAGPPPTKANSCYHNVNGVFHCDTFKKASYCEINAAGQPETGSIACGN